MEFLAGQYLTDKGPFLARDNIFRRHRANPQIGAAVEPNKNIIKADNHRTA